MTDDPRTMSCNEFQDQLPELIGSGESIANQPQYKDCALYRALLADLETIAEAARQLLPVVEPPDDLWEHIESAIQQEDQSLEKG